MRSPITVVLERGEGFFRRLQVESFPHFEKEQITRRKTGTSNIQADTDRCKQTQMDRQTVSLVDVTEEREGVTNVSFREVSHDRRNSVKFNSAIFTTELLKIQLN